MRKPRASRWIAGVSPAWSWSRTWGGCIRRVRCSRTWSAMSAASTKRTRRRWAMPAVPIRTPARPGWSAITRRNCAASPASGDWKPMSTGVPCVRWTRCRPRPAPTCGCRSTSTCSGRWWTPSPNWKAPRWRWIRAAARSWRWSACRPTTPTCSSTASAMPTTRRSTTTLRARSSTVRCWAASRRVRPSSRCSRWPAWTAACARQRTRPCRRACSTWAASAAAMAIHIAVGMAGPTCASRSTNR